MRQYSAEILMVLDSFYSEYLCSSANRSQFSQLNSDIIRIIRIECYHTQLNFPDLTNHHRSVGKENSICTWLRKSECANQQCDSSCKNLHRCENYSTTEKPTRK